MVEKLGFAGCLGLAATLTSKNVLKLGAWLVAASTLLWFHQFRSVWRGLGRVVLAQRQKPRPSRYSVQVRRCWPLVVFASVG